MMYRKKENLMKCPVCKTVDLQLTTREGVEIDYCPTCRGVWLDRGELDKIIARSSAYDDDDVPVKSGPEPVYRPEREQKPPYRAEKSRDWDEDYDDKRRYADYDDRPRKKKKSSFLGELFDF